MRIVLHDYGGFSFTFQIAEYLASIGIETHYLHGGSMQAVQRSRQSSQEPHLFIDKTDIAQSFAKYTFQKRWFQEKEYGQNLARKIVKINPDIIISSTCPLDAQEILLNLSKKKHKKFIFWWQDVSSLLIKNILINKNRQLGWLVGEYYRAMERAQLRHSHKVIAITEEFRAPYRQWGLDESKFHILPNWAPLEEIPLLPKDNPWARRHGLQDKFVFLYSGVLALKHNPALLLALADHFLSQPEIAIVVISQGPGADWLLANPRSNLRVFPFQPYEEYPRALASANVLLAVLEEQAGAYSVPSKTLTYLCAGKPILLSAPLANQSARLVLEQKAGLVAPAGQPGEFCSLAAQLSNNHDKCHQLGLNARQYAEKTFKLDKISAQFLEIISSA